MQKSIFSWPYIKHNFTSHIILIGTSNDVTEIDTMVSNDLIISFLDTCFGSLAKMYLKKTVTVALLASICFMYLTAAKECFYSVMFKKEYVDKMPSENPLDRISDVTLMECMSACYKTCGENCTVCFFVEEHGVCSFFSNTLKCLTLVDQPATSGYGE